jgi:hypothetical protein
VFTHNCETGNFGKGGGAVEPKITIKQFASPMSLFRLYLGYILHDETSIHGLL